MPIDTKPEEKIIYGAELEAAITDGIQRAIGRRVSNLRVSFADGSVAFQAADDIDGDAEVLHPAPSPRRLRPS